MIRAFHAIVHGRVQGVWFRGSTRSRAIQLGISGWVRNLPDGAVEAWAEGEEDRLEQLADWLRQGPPHARVDRVALDWGEPEGGHDGFEVRYR